MPKVLITGITGQDGSYLAENYMSDAYEVHGLVRRSSIVQRPRIDHLYNSNVTAETQRLHLHYADLSDTTALVRVIDKVQPNYVINLAAQSHVAVSFEVPLETANVTGLGALALFEAVRIVNPAIRVYQAGSSEMFGGMLGRQSLDEESGFFPKSPYANAKVFAHHSATIYRDSYGMHISNGILFNHESPRRGENFVSRKITIAAARISMGLQEKLFLGNLEAKRDWGHASEYVRAIRLMVEAETPDDFVVATGKSYSVREFASKTFMKLNLDFDKYVTIDKSLLRPNEVEDLLGNPNKIEKKLGWKHEIDLDGLIDDMLKTDLENAKFEKLKKHV